ncbi:hypothetical protein HDU96_003688 [Phlyctochytrium bullatum]|nr:hypothetical protein HDU96_003688 [Phlyctochytrium bullatum]
MEGTWTISPLRTGVVGIHAALLPQSRVVLWERFHGLHAPSLYAPNPNTFVPRIGQSEISTELDLAAGTVSTKHMNYSAFCAGHAQMADGSILVAGGDGDNVGNGYIKDGRGAIRRYTSTEGWKDIGTLLQTRWYPTVTMVGPDRFLIVGGHTESYVPGDFGRSNPTLEMWPPGPEGLVHVPILTDTYPFNTYPIVQLLPSGRVFMFAGTRACILDLPSMAMTELPRLAKPGLWPRSFPYLSPSILLPLTPRNNYTATILLCGGTEKTGEATRSCSTITPDEPRAAWVDEEDMPVPRVMGDAVLMPTGEVIFVNGARKGTADGPAGFTMAHDPSYQAVAYNPEAEPGRRWRSLAKATVPRLYHSSALLLQDGTIATFGSDQQNYDDPATDPFEYRMEVLDVSATPEARPRIVGAPATLACGQAFDALVQNIDEDVDASRLRMSIIRYGTSTHSTNMDSRMVELEVVGWVQEVGRAAKMRLRMPASGRIVPSGNWMLFAAVRGSVGMFSEGWTMNIRC